MTARMALRRALSKLTLCVLGAGWLVASATVHAAQKHPDLVSLPWLQILLGAWIAAWGGAAATLTRYLAATYEDRPFFVRIEVVKDLVVSGLVGGMTYFTGSLYEWSPMVVGLALLMSGWLGVRLLNVLADRVLAAATTAGLK